MGINHQGPIIRDGLVLCLDAANPKSYPGSGTTWYDLSGNGNNGTLTNGPTFDVNNKGSVVFDGVDDSISTTYGPQLSNFTIFVWFRSTGGSLNFNRLVDKAYNTGLWIGRENNLSNKWGGGVLESVSPYGRYITLSDNQWHLIVSKREGSTHTIFGDGTSNYVSGTVSSALTGTTTFAFGNWSGANNVQCLTGNISNIQIYNRALSQSEIQQNFQALRGRYGI